MKSYNYNRFFLSPSHFDINKVTVNYFIVVRFRG